MLHKSLSRSIFYFLTFAAILCLLTTFGCNKKRERPSLLNSQELGVVYPPEVAGFMQSMIEQFQLSAPKLPDGSAIRVRLYKENGLQAAERIASGSLKTHLWLAPSSSFVNYANAVQKNLGPRQVECEQLFATPVVIATKVQNIPMFNASKRVFSWQQFVRETGAFLPKKGKDTRNIYFNHGSPLLSSSCLTSLFQLARIAIPVEGGLTRADL
ncbi:MAG: hypothetical protein KDD53_04765 [Bdellovibrionales bacterium]|nr:hypothetical protein [Bdellovibrionales bacterium]